MKLATAIRYTYLERPLSNRPRVSARQKSKLNLDEDSLVIDPQRSALMARIRGKNTQPEIIARRAIHARGFRYRLHRTDLPGKPDIVISRLQLAIFVNGCFWHQHANCRIAHQPQSRRIFWRNKLALNVKRDFQAQRKLAQAGWNVAVIWECEIKIPQVFAHRLDEILNCKTLARNGPAMGSR